MTSGSRELAEARLRAGGLAAHPVTITADDVERGKPDPEGYLAAADGDHRGYACRAITGRDQAARRHRVLWRAGLRISEALVLTETILSLRAAPCWFAEPKAANGARWGWTAGPGRTSSSGSRSVRAFL